MVPFPQNCKRCLELARANTANPFPPNHREPRTVAYQTIFFAKEYAISAWQVRWHNASRRTIWPSPPPKRETRTSHKRCIEKFKVGRHHRSPPHDRSRLRLLLHSPLPPTQRNHLPDLQGKPPNCRTCHQILPALRKGQGCLSLPDSP